MANCTYTFTDGTTIKGIPALKAFLVNGGLDTYLPERAMEMQGPAASARQTDTPAFKKWFGDSEVVDGSGEPLVVYHGTTDKDSDGGITAFKSSKTGKLGAGVYMTAESSRASNYAKEKGIGGRGAYVLPVYASLKNPVVFVEQKNGLVLETRPDLFGKESPYGRLDGNEIQQVLVDAGYDGAIIKDTNGVLVEILAFKPTQIKSAIGNTGAFDPENPDIRFSARQTDTPAFKKWFGDSEVVDDAGKPMVVYHSTPEDFSVFDTARSELGSHFGPAEQANTFGGSNGRRIMPVYLSIKKPIRLVDYGQWDAANTWGQLVDLGVVEDEGDKISDSLVGMATGGAGDKVVQDALIKAGYDGIVYLNRREGFDPFGPDGVDGNELNEMTDEEVMDYFPEAQDSYIVFKPTQIKSAIGNTGAFDPENPDIRFSRAQPLTPEDARMGGFERSLLGFYSALARGLQGAPIKLASADAWQMAVKGMVNKGLVKADEVEWSGINDWLAAQPGKVSKDEVAQYLKQGGVKVEETTLTGSPNEGAWIPEDSTEEYQSEPAQPAKYGQYTLPGGENYREVLLTLPQKAAPAPEPKGEIVEDGKDAKYPFAIMVNGKEENRVTTRDTAAAVLEEELGRARAKAARTAEKASSYRSSHWDQPNVLAHIRMNDRIDSDGKRVLFVEELQSDWGQEGKKKGFSDPTARKKADEVSEEMRRLAADREQPSNRIREERRWSELANQRDEMMRKADGVLAAPFVTKTEGWLNLALKRILVMAAEGGYDKVAFINGEQSAERYDLSKQVDSIAWQKMPYGKYNIQAIKDDAEVVSKKDMSIDEVGDAIGKDAAKKISEQSAEYERTQQTQMGTLRGLDLKVGGEGMKAFYDQIVPMALKKLLPKVGGEKPTSVVFGGEDERGRFVVFDDDSGERLFRTGDRSEAAEYVRVYPGDASIKEVDGSAGVGLSGEQPGFDVTSAMRDKVAEGLPQFSPRQFPSARGQRFTLKDETYTKTVQRNLQDYFARVADVQGALSAQGGKVGEAQNVYLAEELSYGRLQEQMVDFKEDMLKPLIKEAKAAGLELSDLALYAYAKHAPERNQAIASRNKTFGKGEGSGMTTSEANNIMRAFKAEGKDTALADLHDKLMQITQATRLVLLSEGLITQDQFDSLQRQYSDYVPLRGFTEDEDLESGRPVAGPRVGGRGFNIRGKETMRALGRESRAGHVIENIVLDYERAVARAERNNVAKVFLDLVTTNPDPGLWEIDSVRTKAAFDRATGMVRYNTLIDKGEDTISVKIDGNEIYIKIKDPLLLRAMRNAGKDETGAIDRVLAMTLGRYTALMRNTLTRYNPAFGFTNAVKDLGFGAVSALSDLGPKGAALFFKNYANPVQSGQMFEEFRAAGATTGGWHIRDQQEMQKELQRLVEWEGGSSIKSTAYSMGKATLDALEFIGQYSETQARFAAYKAARQLNKSPADAAGIAKNLTTNFNRKGEWGSAMNTMYLFFNAGVQGSVKTVKNLRSPYVMAAMAGLSGMAAGLAFMGAGVGGDDDDGEAYWDKIPQFEKERNLIIMLPPGEGMMVKGETKVGKNGRYFKLPIQYGINVFSTLGYQIADLARYTQNHSRGVSPAKAATNMVSVTFGSFNPFGGGFNPSKPTEVALAVSPSVVDLGVQALMGVNSFGTPVAPRKYDDVKPDAENFGPGMAGTWEQRLARWLSESTGGNRAVGGAIDVSPGSIRNIVRNLTGGTGDFLASVFVNIPSKMWSPEGEVGPRDVPVLKAFYGEVDDVTDSKLFYERKAEVLEAAKQASDRQKLGIEVEYDPESKGLQSLGNSAKSYTKKMTELRKQELKVAEDSSLTEAQKNSERKAIQKERAQIASEFNALYYGMKKDLAAVK